MPPKAEPQPKQDAADNHGFEEEWDGEGEQEDEWFLPHQENTEDRSSHGHGYFVDNQGSNTFNRTCNNLLILALNSIVSRQDAPLKAPMGKMPVFLDSYRTFPRFPKDQEVFLGDFYAFASEGTPVSEVKQKCFSAQVLCKVENCETMDSIMNQT